MSATSSVERSNSDRSGSRGENYETDETLLQYISAKSTIVLRLVPRHAVKTFLYDFFFFKWLHIDEEK